MTYALAGLSRRDSSMRLQSLHHLPLQTPHPHTHPQPSPLDLTPTLPTSDWDVSGCLLKCVLAKRFRLASMTSQSTQANVYGNKYSGHYLRNTFTTCS